MDQIRTALDQLLLSMYLTTPGDSATDVAKVVTFEVLQSLIRLISYLQLDDMRKQEILQSVLEGLSGELE